LEKADYEKTYKITENNISLLPNLITGLNEITNPAEYFKINELFSIKCNNLLKYQCRVKMENYFGSFMWCGNMSSPTGSGYVLTNNNLKAEVKYALNLYLIMNDELFRETDFIDLYNCENFLMGYNVSSINSQFWSTSKLIDPKFIGTDITVIFSKKKALSEKEEALVRKNFSRIPRQEIYTIKIKIQDLIQYGDKTDCNICLESVNSDNDKYITPCGHLFHLKCIFEYLESKDELYPLHSQCARVYPNGNQSCCNARKIKIFNCPSCNQKVNPISKQ
jgi:hypothetical protein